MTKLQDLKKQLHSGSVYRREDLLVWSKSVDRHLKQLIQDGTLIKLSGGLYYCPKHTIFGEVPADDKKLITSFLKDQRFLITSLNAYNALGLGITQLYNETIVYNHKRHGRFKIGGRTLDFRVKHCFPKKLTAEFLLIDLLNNLDNIAEDTSALISKLKSKIAIYDKKSLKTAILEYGNLKCKKLLMTLLENS